MVLQKNNPKEIKATDDMVIMMRNSIIPLKSKLPTMSMKTMKLFHRIGIMRKIMQIGNGRLGGILVGWLAFCSLSCAAESSVETALTVGLEAPFLDHAVLQQQMPLPVS